MALTSTPSADNFIPAPNIQSAVSWGAVIAGAAAAAALSLVLLILGVGLGLSSVSPWSQQGASATGMGVSTILWLTLTQLLASAMGGYLAGRLRAKWTEVHPDEVYFRDTAHGFLTWAVASLVTAALLTSAIASILGAGASGAAQPQDIRYVGQVVAQSTGLSQADAEKRVADVLAKSQASPQDLQPPSPEALDKARKASAYSALWLFVSLLLGAFFASLAATFGGRQRDA